MNELIWLLQVGIIVGAIILAARRGREALTTAVTVLWITANLFVLKQVSLFGLVVTAADSYIIGSILALNLGQDLFGNEFARRSINTAILFSIVFVAFGYVHLMFIPATLDLYQQHYHALLLIGPRLVGASLLTSYVAAHAERLAFRAITHIADAPWTVASMIAAFLGQVLDTAMFSVLGLYGVVSNLIDVVVVAIVIKTICIVGMTFLVGYLKKHILSMQRPV